MKEAIAQTFIVSIILFFFGVLLILFFGSINYSKAFKAKNKLINIVEKYGDSISTDSNVQKEFKDEFESELKKSGYQTVDLAGVNSNFCNKYFDTSLGEELIYPDESSKNLKRSFNFCLIKKEASVGPYYQVITFMKFDVPIIGNTLVFPVRGETKVLCDNIDSCNTK